MSLSSAPPLRARHDHEPHVLRPFLTVVMPALNQEKHIEDTLQHLLSQDYPEDRYEILVVDGGSTDATNTIVAAMQARYPLIKLLDYPGTNIPEALNAGIAHAAGEIIVRMDSHSIPPADYLALCVDLLRETGATHVGGTLHAKGSSFWGESIAMGITSLFGVGNSLHRVSQKEGTEEAGYLGAFRKSVLLNHGGYDPSCAFSEDAELSYRLLRRGETFFRTPRLGVTYLCRNSLRALWRQYFCYGLYKQRLIKKHRRVPSVRHAVPTLFLLSLFALVVLSFVHPLFLIMTGIVLGMYGLLGVAFSLHLALRSGWRFLFSMPAVFATLHLSYGLGSLAGIWKFWV